jgi:hypothetical protein
VTHGALRYAVDSCDAHADANPTTMVANAIGATKRDAPLLSAPTIPVPAPLSWAMRPSDSESRAAACDFCAASPHVSPTCTTPKRTARGDG